MNGPQQILGANFGDLPHFLPPWRHTAKSKSGSLKRKSFSFQQHGGYAPTKLTSKTKIAILRLKYLIELFIWTKIKMADVSAHHVYYKTSMLCHQDVYKRLSDMRKVISFAYLGMGPVCSGGGEPRVWRGGWLSILFTFYRSFILIIICRMWFALGLITESNVNNAQIEKIKFMFH